MRRLISLVTVGTIAMSLSVTTFAREMGTSSGVCANRVGFNKLVCKEVKRQVKTEVKTVRSSARSSVANIRETALNSLKRQDAAAHERIARCADKRGTDKARCLNLAKGKRAVIRAVPKVKEKCGDMVGLDKLRCLNKALKMEKSSSSSSVSSSVSSTSSSSSSSSSSVSSSESSSSTTSSSSSSSSN